MPKIVTQPYSILLTLLCVHSAFSHLYLNDDGLLRIVQITDTLLGANSIYDFKTLESVRTIMEQEQPDLVVMTGNIVAGSVWANSAESDQTEGWFEDQYQPLVAIFKDYDVPWVLTCGDEDD